MKEKHTHHQPTERAICTDLPSRIPFKFCCLLSFRFLASVRTNTKRLNANETPSTRKCDSKNWKAKRETTLWYHMDDIGCRMKKKKDFASIWFPFLLAAIISSTNNKRLSFQDCPRRIPNMPSGWSLTNFLSWMKKCDKSTHVLYWFCRVYTPVTSICA